MAYLDLAERFSTAQLQIPFVPARVEQETVSDFAAREWQVVKLARNDRLSSLREESEFVGFLRMVFGFERKKPLANPRLEALRRMAVLSWHHGYNVSSGEISDFFAAGYSIDQYDAMLAHIGQARAASFRRPRR